MTHRVNLSFLKDRKQGINKSRHAKSNSVPQISSYGWKSLWKFLSTSPQNAVTSTIWKMPQTPFQPMQQRLCLSPSLFDTVSPQSLQSMPPFGHLQVGILENGVSNPPSPFKRHITAGFLPLTWRHLKPRLVHLLLGKQVSMHFLTSLWPVS